MIPAQAVEAAAKMMAMSSAEAWSDEQWDNPRVHDAYRQPWRDEARRILEAAAPHMQVGDVEWTVFRASDGPNGSPAENLRYSTKAGAQESIDTRYGTPELWEPRSRIVGRWRR